MLGVYNSSPWSLHNVFSGLVVLGLTYICPIMLGWILILVQSHTPPSIGRVCPVGAVVAAIIILIVIIIASLGAVASVATAAKRYLRQATIVAQTTKASQQTWQPQSPRYDAIVRLPFRLTFSTAHCLTP